ncbi:MAG TPA: DUF3455 domain-containing protein [Thermoanaerobaculia bacterium]|nr:DUF3455 domain-containing protein [Thermoanaerobaculia bacterium]
MKNRSTIGTAILSLAVALSASGNLKGETPTAVPEKLKVPDTQRLSLEVQATGVQIYACTASKTDPARFEWVFKAPEADFFDSANKKLGSHYAGPTWESTDGSKVVGELKAKDDGPDPTAIPWLLMTAKSTSGTGVFARTLSIQRLHTVGGKAPAEGCDQAHAGKEARIAYKATYTFSVAKP